MPSRKMRPLQVLGLAAALVALAATAPWGHAVPVLRYDAAVRGNLATTGNTLGLAGTASGPGTNDGIGAFTDATATLQVPGWPLGTTLDWTLNSSTGVLDLPSGATILHAELVWGGTVSAAVLGSLDAPVTFRTPSGLVHEVTPLATTGSPAGGTMRNAGYYGRSANVTALVEGGGTYRVGRVPSALTGGDAAAGWALVVAYGLPSETPKRLAIHTLMEDVDTSANADRTVEVAGLCIPSASANRSARLSYVAIDGDASVTGETLRFARLDSQLGDAGSRIAPPGTTLTNPLVSRVAGNDGLVDTRGTFGTANHTASSNVAGARQGFDLANIDTTTPLSTNWTSAFFRPIASDDLHSALAVAMALRHRTPLISDTGAVVAVTPSQATLGTVLTVTVTLQNTGDATADAPRFTLTLPAGLSYVPSSFLVNNVNPPSGAVTSAAALTTGITLPTIGEGAVSTVRLQVRVDARPATFTFAPRVTYTNQVCAGALVVDTFDPTFIAPITLTECGNGRLEVGEVCDDGNTSALDGCSASCAPESGWTCGANPNTQGTPTNPDSRCSASCGDGLLALGAERCDDGNRLAQDGCNPSCLIEYGYACDGPPGVVGPNGHCRAVCGDGQLARGAETCDDGNAVSGDGCSATCQVTPGWACTDRAPGSGSPASPDSVCSAGCGDGQVAEGRERCDDGNLASGDGCGPSCFIEYGWACLGPPGGVGHCSSVCGDGQLAKLAEACDDANTLAGDGCSPTCAVEPGWACSERPPGSGGPANPDSACTTTCGDGIPVAGREACDDGGLVAGDGCSPECQPERGWECDPACSPIACGDGVRALPSEACDDGNTVDGDGCRADCEVEDGFVCTHTALDGDGEPDTDCESVCGDGKRLGTELCDDGNEVSGDGCAGCGIEDGWGCDGPLGGLSVCAPVCGDGRLLGGEVCDDGNTSPDPAVTPVEDPDGCAFDCSAVDFGWTCSGEPSVCLTTCGDGLVGLEVERCDDGNTVAGDGCAADCAGVERGWSCGDPVASPSVCEPLCGDGLVRGVEGCDDGDNDDGDGCSADCRVEEDWVCFEEDTESPSVCFQDSDGDGVYDDGDFSGVVGDNPCEVGVPVVEGGCDDNCPAFFNSDQQYPEKPSPLCPPYDGPRTQGGGGGCSGGLSSLFGSIWGLVLMMVLWRGRRVGMRVGLIALVGVGAFGSAREVLAQEVDPRAFSTALSPHGVLGVESTALGGHLAPFFGLGASYANDEVITRVSADGTERGPLRERFITTFFGGLSLWSRLEVALGVPLMATTLSSGGLSVGEGRERGELGLGDLRLAVRGRLLGAGAVGEAGFGLGLSGELTIPTGSGDFRGDGGVGGLLMLVADWRDGYGHVLALNAGYRVRPEVAVDDLVVDDEVRFGLGAEVALGAVADLRFAMVGELGVGLGLGDSAYDEGGIAGREVQVEALGGLKVRADDVTAHLAAGAGLSQGYGAADFRVVFGVSLLAQAPRVREEPLVAMSKLTRHDDWEDEAKTSTLEPVRSDAPVPVEAFDKVVLADPDSDNDGVLSAADRCLNEPEDLDGFEDGDGCPDPDNDGDGIVDAADRCPAEKEVFNGVDDEDGCPDEGAALLTKDGDVLKIPDRIRFKSGSAELLPSDKAILDPVAAALKAMGGTLRIRIEGHTDNAGDREFNVDLAERRAWSVRSYLMEQGVDGERLFAKGFGSTRPVASNTTDAGRAQNRRVEFHVIKPGERLEGDIK